MSDRQIRAALCVFVLLALFPGFAAALDVSVALKSGTTLENQVKRAVGSANTRSVTSLTITGTQFIAADALWTRTELRDCLVSLDMASLQISALPASAFTGMSALRYIKLPPTMTSIGESAFCNATSLTRVELPSSLQTIAPYTFQVCSSLLEINLPSDLVSIGQGAFQNCTSLADLSLPAKLTSIRGTAFSGCTKLSLRELPPSLETIGTNAFSKCSALSISYLPKRLTTIDAGVFNLCTAMPEKLYVAAPTPPTLTARTFDNSDVRTIVTPPGSAALYAERWTQEMLSNASQITFRESAKSVAVANVPAQPLEEGASLDLDVSLEFEDGVPAASCDASLIWSVADESIASVDMSTNRLSVLQAGRTRVSVANYDSAFEFVVEVVEKPAEPPAPPPENPDPGDPPEQPADHVTPPSGDGKDNGDANAPSDSGDENKEEAQSEDIAPPADDTPDGEPDAPDGATSGDSKTTTRSGGRARNCDGTETPFALLLALPAYLASRRR